LLACETRWPFIGFLPVTWQTRDILSTPAEHETGGLYRGIFP
jgi:hypothetical protein